MNRLALLVLGALLTLPAWPATLNVSWSHPTEFTDGSPLAVSQIQHTRIEYGDCSAPGVWGTKQGETTVVPPATSVQITVSGWGNKCVRGYTRATAAAGGLESAASNVAYKLVPVPQPKPPTMTTVENFVYELNLKGNGEIKLASRVGTVAFGVPCGDVPVVQRGGRTYYEVSPEYVDFARAPNSAIVVAACAPV